MIKPGIIPARTAFRMITTRYPEAG